jgi:hypothetical protein
MQSTNSSDPTPLIVYRRSTRVADKMVVLASDCCKSRFVALSRAAGRSLASRLRQMGLGRVAADWPQRAAVCERCPLRVIRGGTSYCGPPFLEQTDRDASTHGCGCPTHAKARDPAEHCPLGSRNRPATRNAHTCDCKWCAAA